MMYRIQRFIPDGQYVAVMYRILQLPCWSNGIDVYDVYKASNDINWLKEHYPECSYITREEYFSLPLR